MATLTSTPLPPVKSPRITLYAATAISCLAWASFALGQSPDEQLQQQIARVPLPGAFNSTVLVYINDSDKPDQEFKIWSGPNWSIGLQSLAQPGIGFIPYDYCYANDEETWRYHFDSQRAERSKLFAQWHTTSFETSTPLGLLRQLRLSSPQVVSRKIEDGVISFTVVPTGPAGTARRVLEFDSESGFLLRTRTVFSGQMTSEIKFEDWRKLPSGNYVPHLVYFSAPGEGPDEPDLQMTYIHTNLAEIDGESPPTRFPLAPGFTIVDEIDGVTRRADGTELGSIERGQPTGAITSGRSPGSTGLTSRTVMFIGVGFILVAGVILGVRRWKGA